MKAVTPALLFTIFAGGCASMATPVPGLVPDTFVRLSCADNKTFQLRANADGKSIRVRGLHGSAELEAKGDGTFAGEGYLLRSQGADAVSLDHEGKSQGKGCKTMP